MMNKRAQKTPNPGGLALYTIENHINSDENIHRNSQSTTIQ